MVAGSSEVGGVAGGELRGRGGYGGEVLLCSGGRRPKLVSWAAPQGLGETTGGAGWAKEWLAAMNFTGAWRRPNQLELGKRASPGQTTAWGALEGRLEVA